MFCVLAALTALAAAEPPAPTPEQRELVGKITGVGRLRFGMAPNDFSNGTLVGNSNAPNIESNMKYFTCTDLDGITWGRLAPDRIDLGFYYDHLIDIRLHFTQPFGDLLAVTHAAAEKYGTPRWDHWMTVDGPSTQAGYWSGTDAKVTTVEMQLAFPHYVPAGADESTLAQKIGGLLELSAPNLLYELRQSHQQDLEQQTLKTHDLEKIKSDL
jgi:hypothetical protein